MGRLLYIVCFLWITIVILASCDKLSPAAPEEDSLLDGPVEGLTPTQNNLFLKGDVAFNDEVFTPVTGLGPILVSTSCGSCHAGDGKGHPSATLTRFGRYQSNGEFDYLIEKGGPQLQHRAIPGFEPEEIPAEATGIVRLTPPINTGLGFLEAVPDSELLAMSDPDDNDGDGISGKVNWVIPADYHFPSSLSVVDTANGYKRYIGRFGKKAGTINLLQQTVVAYKQDMGITSDFDTEDIFNPLTGHLSNDNTPDPEVSGATVSNVVFYLRTLKAPIQRNQNNPNVIEGKQIFIDINCSGCHKTKLKTGISDIGALSEREFSPYTDLLMHDMGPGLDDKYTEGSAETYEWRTAPLWGLGLAPNSQGGQYFLLHDGRAKSIEEAIQYHGGEAEMSKNLYNALTEDQRKKLIQFLESL